MLPMSPTDTYLYLHQQVDLVGVQKLHSYLGFASFFAGIAAVGGPPLAGNANFTHLTIPTTGIQW